MHPSPAVTNLVYLVASVLFIWGLKGLSHPRTAVRGNLLGALGMLLAVAVTLLDSQVLDYRWLGLGLALGTAAGLVLALRIAMTAMPQLVALLNGFGGLASALVAGAELAKGIPAGRYQVLGATAASGLVGALTFTGSVVAFAKLQELMKGDVRGGWLKATNLLLLVASLALAAWVVRDPSTRAAYWALVLAASALGVGLVVPIGGADMPVVIALLNSYSGIAAAATGFVFSPANHVLIVSGALVGASGIILTRIMCKAMNRSLANVVFGVLGPTEGGASADEVYGGKVKATTPEEVAMLFDTARRVVVVPGYGMAVAQAQHAVRELMNILGRRGVEVEFAIHPVAGRMPGHMNVLLAEADIPYDRLKEMDQINPSLPEVDVAIVLGANDVVNPLARTDPKSPIAGMPIIDVDRCRTVVVVKRSLSPGFAGIPNPLFANPNTLMLFGDGKKAILELNAALQDGR